MLPLLHSSWCFINAIITILFVIRVIERHGKAFKGFHDDEFVVYWDEQWGKLDGDPELCIFFIPFAAFERFIVTSESRSSSINWNKASQIFTWFRNVLSVSTFNQRLLNFQLRTFTAFRFLKGIMKSHLQVLKLHLFINLLFLITTIREFHNLK